jgi:hypothetical protein
MKVRPLAAEFPADGETEGWTDMKKAIVWFPNFANAPKMDVQNVKNKLFHKPPTSNSLHSDLRQRFLEQFTVWRAWPTCDKN